MRSVWMTLSVLATFFLVATILGIVVGPEWIEVMTGFDPDKGSGAVEVLLVVVPAVLTVGLGLSAGLCRRRTAAA